MVRGAGPGEIHFGFQPQQGAAGTLVEGEGGQGGGGACLWLGIGPRHRAKGTDWLRVSPIPERAVRV